MLKFHQTLNDKEVNSSINVGFRLRGKYSQEQIGLNYFYCKRVVQNDGVSTSPLHMTLCPWDNEVELVEKIQSSLFSIYFVKIRFEKYSFYLLEQLYFLLAKHYENKELCEQIALENE